VAGTIRTSEALVWSYWLLHHSHNYE